jgi:hypothetical protein
MLKITKIETHLKCIILEKTKKSYYETLLVLLHILEPALRYTSIVITEMNMSKHVEIF